jgi:hypothetical protein
MMASLSGHLETELESKSESTVSRVGSVGSGGAGGEGVGQIDGSGGPAENPGQG